MPHIRRCRGWWGVAVLGRRRSGFPPALAAGPGPRSAASSRRRGGGAGGAPDLHGEAGRMPALHCDASWASFGYSTCIGTVNPTGSSESVVKIRPHPSPLPRERVNRRHVSLIESVSWWDRRLAALVFPTGETGRLESRRYGAHALGP